MSNVVERTIRSIALNRSSPVPTAAASTWAIIASLIETCKLNAIDPQTDLADVITRIVNGRPNSLIDDLLPWAYAPIPRPQSRGLKTPLTLFEQEELISYLKNMFEDTKKSVFEYVVYDSSGVERTFAEQMEKK